MAAMAYERQCLRLQERCQAEASQGRAAAESLGRSTSELQDLRAECRGLGTQLEAIEAERQKVLSDFTQAKCLTQRTAPRFGGRRAMFSYGF